MTADALKKGLKLMSTAVEFQGKVLFSENTISERVKGLAKHIAHESPDDLLIVSILKGSVIFTADLLRELHRQGSSPEVDFLTLQSYKGGKTSTGQVELTRDILSDPSDRHVILVDDILESGRTLHFAKEHIRSRGARSVETCVLLTKAVERAVPIEADFSAFQCPDCFVVGYGMDFRNRYRELPFIADLSN